MILLAGGLGFIGSNIAIELLKKNYNIVIVDNLSNSDISCLHILHELCLLYNIDNKNLNFVNIDLTNYSDTKNIFDVYNINHVINLAGKKSVNESINLPNEYYYNNIFVHLNLVKLCDKYNISSYIFSSSATVYGSSKSPLNENSETGIGITNPYGQTKYMIEQMIKDFSKVSKIKFIILRYFNPVGSDITHKLGENPKNIPNNLMPIILSKLKTTNEISIYGNTYNTPDGTCLRDFIHIYDLSIGHIKAINYIEKMHNNLEIFNLGTGNCISVFSIIKKFNEVNNVNLKINISEKREGDIDVCWANIDKAKNLLNFIPIKSIDDMCIDSFLFYNKKFDTTSLNIPKY